MSLRSAGFEPALQRLKVSCFAIKLRSLLNIDIHLCLILIVIS